MRKNVGKIVRKDARNDMRKNVGKIVKHGALICLGLVLAVQVRQVLAAGEFRPLGGRASGMSGIAVAVPDYWSAANNQAANAWNEGIFCGVFFENRYMVQELSYTSLLFTACIRPGSISFICSHFGTGVYSEFKSGIGYAKKFGRFFSAGVQLNYYRFQISDSYGSKNIFNCEIGLMFKPGKQVRVGFHCINPVPVKLSETSGESLPTLLQLGLAYYFTDDLMLSAEIEKDPVSKACARIGAEYRFAKVLSARAGIATGPFRLSIGAGIVISRFSLDFASEYNQVLGFSPAVSLQYKLRK